MINTGLSVIQSLRYAVFMTASVTSSTGFELMSVTSFPELSRLLFLVLMFVGGSLGSTTGGFKMLRLGVMLKVVKREIREFSIPRNALNLVMV
ncbi:MAG: potassium transporter TrkG, partial [Candidatus Nanohaloarchaea archaeon]|nr:potassium transporter TrkG [Candidatus Nanohaloarchaea archaeon]